MDLLRELEESGEIEIPEIGVPHQTGESQEKEESKVVEEEMKWWQRMEKAANILMEDVNDIPHYTSLDLQTFDELVEGATENLKMTTLRGNRRKNVSTATVIPVHALIFMALFWLRFYPAVDLCSRFTNRHAQRSLKG